MKKKLLKTLLEPIDLLENQNVIANEVKQSKNRLLRRFTPRNDGKKAFTLAEILITLTLLGLVAAISIPSIMRTQNEAAERTKLKKSIVDYEKLISNMTIENDLTSIKALKEFANQPDCSNSRMYFKIKQDDTKNVAGVGKCAFQTSNGVWWNIEDITRPVISAKGVDNLSTADGENSFLLTTTYSDIARAFIVDDLNSTELTDDEKAQLGKTLAFAKIITEESDNSSNEANLYKINTKQCDEGETSSCVNYAASVGNTSFYDANGTEYKVSILCFNGRLNEENCKDGGICHADSFDSVENDKQAQICKNTLEYTYEVDCGNGHTLYSSYETDFNDCNMY